MAIDEGRHQIGSGDGSITLRTTRDGLAAGAGHDLTLDASRWSGAVEVAAGQVPTGLEVTVDLGSLVVRSGSGGIKPLTDADKRQIAANAAKTLKADRYPQAHFTATAFEPDPDGGGGTIAGTLTLAGQARPLRLSVSRTAPGRYRAVTTVRQTDFGIRPYSALLGSLKVADDVEVEAEIGLPS